jgi:ribose transport system substrate-binding protein
MFNINRRKGEGMSRREFMMSSFLLGAGVAAPNVLSLINARRVQAQDQPLRCAMSNAGLAASWCAQGKETAEQWGQWLGVEVTWFDGKLDTAIQRSAVDQIATQADQWDFVAIQPLSIDSLVEPIQALIDAGVPVIDMDTLIAPMTQMEEMGILTFIAPDNVFMSEAVVQRLVDSMGGQGQIAHTWGSQGHTGAQGRAQGFYNIMAKYPDIEVVDDQPGDWDVTRVASIWETLLNRFPDLKAGFLHNDDMALAAKQMVDNAGLGDQILIGGIDAMLPAIQAVNDGKLVATARNPAPRIHGDAVLAGVYAATVGLEQAQADIPSFILADGPAIFADIDSNPELAETPWKLRGYGQSTAPGLRWLEEQLVF